MIVGIRRNTNTNWQIVQAVCGNEISFVSGQSFVVDDRVCQYCKYRFAYGARNQTWKQLKLYQHIYNGFLKYIAMIVCNIRFSGGCKHWHNAAWFWYVYLYVLQQGINMLGWQCYTCLHQLKWKYEIQVAKIWNTFIPTDSDRRMPTRGFT